MYKDILLPVDLNAESSWKQALPTAIEFCRKFGSRLHVITVVPDFGMSIVSTYFPEGYKDKILKEVSGQLNAFVKQHVPEGIEAQPIVGYGTAYEEILNTARRLDVDIIIMASHRPQLKDYMISPNAARVMRHARRTVMIVREK